MDVYKRAWSGVYYIKNGRSSDTTFVGFCFVRNNSIYISSMKQANISKKTSSFVVGRYSLGNRSRRQEVCLKDIR
jgi:hypothetical protein